MAASASGKLPRTRSTAEARRPAVLSAALHEFATTGYRGTSVGVVATQAGISEGYVFRLFGDKRQLFLAVIRFCFERVSETMEAGALEAASTEPSAVLGAMAERYAQLIADRDLMMIQVQALAASDDDEIRAQLTRCQGDLVSYVQERSGAEDDDVQLFFARGYLCHTLTALGLLDRPATADQHWLRALSHGIRHHSPTQEAQPSRPTDTLGKPSRLG